MPIDVKVEIRGLNEVAGAFRRVNADAPAALKSEYSAVAGRVASRAAGLVPKLTGRAAGSLKPRASARGAAIVAGGSAAEHYPWLDFGGRVGRQKSVLRDHVTGGRYIYPTIAAEGDNIKRGTEEAIVNAARKSGFEVR